MKLEQLATPIDRPDVDFTAGIPQTSAPPSSMTVPPVTDPIAPREQALSKWRTENLPRIYRDALNGPDPKADLSFAPTPEEAHQLGTNDSLLSLFLPDGEELPTDGPARAVLRGTVAARLFGQEAPDEASLFSLIRTDAQSKQQQAEIARTVTAAAIENALTTSPAGWSEARAAIQTLPGYDPAKDSDYLEHYLATRATQAAQVEPIRLPLQSVFASLKSGNIEEVTNTALRAFKEIPEKHRATFKEALRARISTLPEQERRTLAQNIGESFQRQIISGYGQAAQEAEGLTTKADTDTSSAIQAIASAVGGGGIYIAPLERRQEQDLQAAQFQAARVFAREITDIFTSEVDPIRSAFGDGGEMGLFESAVTNAPGTIVNSLSMGVPVVGLPYMYGMMKGQAFDNLSRRFQESGMSYEEAAQAAGPLSYPVAILQTGLEKAQFGLWANKVPGLTKAIDKLTDPITNKAARLAARTVAIGIAETGIEAAQDTAELAVQDIAAALSEDIPTVDWQKEFDGAFSKYSEVFLTMLPLAVLGGFGGLSNEARATAFKQATPDQRAALGIKPEDSAAIDAATGPSSLLSSVNQALQNADRNSPEAQAAAAREAVRLTRLRQAEELDTGLDFRIPIITAQTDGTFLIKDPTTRETLASAPTPIAALYVAKRFTAAFDELRGDLFTRLSTELEAARTIADQDATEIESDLSRLFTAEDAAALSPAAAERFAMENERLDLIEGGDGHTPRVVFGYTTTEQRENHRQDVIRLFQGSNLATLYHERWHTLRRRALEQGIITRQDDIALIRAFDQVLPAGQKLIKDPTLTDDQLAEADIDEAIAELGELTTFLFPKGHKTNRHGLTRNTVAKYIGAVGRIAPEATRKFSSFVRAIRDRLGLALTRAFQARRAIDRGELDLGMLDDYIEKITGTADQRTHDANVLALAQERGLVDQDNIPFSLGRSTVTPEPSTNSFQGTNGETVIGPASFSIGAWHASPHKVDRFTTEKMGTGEGAQAYGWGLYFAEDEAVSGPGGVYATKFSNAIRYDGKTVNWQDDAREDPFVTAIELIDSYRGDPEAKKFAMEDAKGYDNAKQIIAQIRRIDPAKIERGSNVYRVTLKVEADELLDWDSNLSEHPQSVANKIREILGLNAEEPRGYEKTVLRKAISAGVSDFDSVAIVIDNDRQLYELATERAKRDSSYDENMQSPGEWVSEKHRKWVESQILTGGQAYDRIEGSKEIEDRTGKTDKQQKASTKLLSAGIKGIRYLDGNSRTAGEGSYNYVIFDGNDIEILEENGQPVDISSPSFSLGLATTADSLALSASRLGRDPLRRIRILKRISSEFARLGQSFRQTELEHGIPKNKAQLKREARLREEIIYEEKVGEIHARFGSLLVDSDLVKIRAQPVHAAIASPGTHLRGSLMSRSQYLRDHPERATAGEYDGSEGVSRTLFGGTQTPDQVAQQLHIDGLIPGPSPADLWDALAKESNTVASLKEMLQKATDQMRQAKIDAKKEANDWLATQSTKQARIFSERQQILSHLRLLDAILLALPQEIRGKIGGHTQAALISGKNTKGLLSFLRDKLDKADKELETYLREEYGREMADILRRAAPQNNEAGQRPTGSIDPDAYRILTHAQRFMSSTFQEAQSEADRLDTLADNPETPIAEADRHRTTAALIRLMGNWSQAPADRRETAVTEATKIYLRGLSHLNIKRAQRNARLADLRRSATLSLKNAGHRMDRVRAKDAQDTRFGAIKDLALGILSYGQIANVLFGETSAVAQFLNRGELAASNAYQDNYQLHLDAVETFFHDLANGDQLQGERIRHRLQHERNIKVTDALGAEHEFTDMQAITYLLMWRQGDGKRHMEGIRNWDEDASQIISDWAWSEESIAAIRDQLSPEGTQFMAFLSDRYASEYPRINAVFERIWNVPLPQNKNYSPLSVRPANDGDANSAIIDPVTGDSMGYGMTPGSLKNRSMAAVAEPEAVDALTAYLQHSRQMEHFIAYAEFARDARTIIQRRDVSNRIKAVSPEAGAKLNKWLEYFSLGGLRANTSSGRDFAILQRSLSRLSSAILVGRLSVLAIQSLQLGAALYKMPAGSYLKRLALLKSGRLSWADAIRSPYIQRRIKEMPPIVRDALDGLKSGKPSQIRYRAAQLSKLIPGADGLFTAGTYAILLDYHRTLAIKEGMDPAAAERHAHREAEFHTDQIAQPVRPGARSWIEVSQQASPAFRVLFNFASDPRQKLSIPIYELLRRDKSQADKALAALRAASVTWLVGGVIASMLRAALRDIRDDEDDTIFDEANWAPSHLAIQAALAPLSGIPFIGPAIEATTYQIFGYYGWGGGTLLDALPKAAMAGKDLITLQSDDIPKDLETLFTGAAFFSPSAAALTPATHLIRDSINLIQNLEGPDPEE